MSGSNNDAPQKIGVRGEIDDLVQSVNKLSQEFESLRRLSTKILKQRETAEGKVQEATASLKKSRTQYKGALDKFQEAEARRLEAAVDIGMSLRFWSVGDQSLSEPSSAILTLTPKQLTAVKALKNSRYCVV